MLAGAVRRTPSTLLVVATLAAISAVALSPEHGDELLSGQACNVCLVRHSPVLQPASAHLLVPVHSLEWIPPSVRPVQRVEPLYSVSANRAPPA